MDRKNKGRKRNIKMMMKISKGKMINFILEIPIELIITKLIVILTINTNELIRLLRKAPLSPLSLAK
jgi:hypothetical protein